MAGHMTPLQVLVAAKLSGTTKQIGDEWGYAFRTNEDAAELALEALEAAGYEVVATPHADLRAIIEATRQKIRSEIESLQPTDANTVWVADALAVVGRVGRVLDSLDEYLASRDGRG